MSVSKMKTILWHGYEPAITDSNFKTSTAGFVWNNFLWEEMSLHDMLAMNVSVGEKSGRFDELSSALKSNPKALVLNWRWDMDEPRRKAAYQRQSFLLQYAFDRKIPVLVHDSDMKAQDELRCWRRDFINSDMTFIVSTPCFFPKDKQRTLFFPYPPEMIENYEKKYDVGYVGNNYERYEQMKQIVNTHKEFHLWGNWLEQSFTRESPEQVKADFPTAIFHGRLDQRDLHETLSQIKVTYHFAKPEYCEHGFIGHRWAEAAFSGCIAVKPKEFRLPTQFEKIFTKSADEILSLQADEYEDFLNLQRRFVRSFSSCAPWIQTLEEISK